jgi:hypothetical protein
MLVLLIARIRCLALDLRSISDSVVLCYAIWKDRTYPIGEFDRTMLHRGVLLRVVCELYYREKLYLIILFVIYKHA